MATKPRQSEIDAAKRYIRRRLDAQNLTEEGVERAFETAAERIASVIAKYKNRGMRLSFTGSSSMSKEIREIIDELIREIESYIWFNAVPDEASDEDNIAIIKHLEEPYHDATFKERETLYRNKYLAALSGIDFDVMELDEAEFAETIREGSSKWEHRLLLLAVTTVGLGWMEYYMRSNSKKTINGIETDATGFWVYPGSSNPCSFCESMFGVFHPMSDPIPIYHPNCCCILVYSYEMNN